MLVFGLAVVIVQISVAVCPSITLYGCGVLNSTSGLLVPVCIFVSLKFAALFETIYQMQIRVCFHEKNHMYFFTM